MRLWEGNGWIGWGVERTSEEKMREGKSGEKRERGRVGC